MASFAEGDRKEVTLEMGDALLPDRVAADALVPIPAPSTPYSPLARYLGPVALGGAGLGLVLVAVGSGFGIAAIEAKSLPAGSCAGGACDSNATARNRALMDGNISTGLFVAGTTLVSAGAVTWFAAPKLGGVQGMWTLTPTVGSRLERCLCECLRQLLRDPRW